MHTYCYIRVIYIYIYVYCSIKQMNKFRFFRFIRKQNTTFNSTVIFVCEKGMSDERWV